MITKNLPSDCIKILLLENNELESKFYSALLKQSFDCAVTIDNSSSIKEALEHIAQSQYDLALVDINVLDSDGVETVKNFREAIGEECPIIVLTGSTDPELRSSALLSGADDYLIKGRDDDNLFTKIISYTVTRYQLIRSGHSDNRFV